MSVDSIRRTRLRWRARRGLLENDLILTRFLDARMDELGDEDIQGLDELLDLTDNELLDLILGRTELKQEQINANSERVLGWLRAA
jgi:antitoxin CptB